MKNRGVDTNITVPQPQVNLYEEPRIGLDNPQMSIPNPHTTRLSDQTVATVALNLHKGGAVMAMHFALECVEPTLRAYHVTSAINCQEMAYEVWQFMNYEGFYQVPQLPDQTMRTMMQAFDY